MNVVGKQDPSVDLKAVQDAVNSGENVFLSGSFYFGLSHVEIKTTKEFVIGGVETDGQMATIEGGTNPFQINATAKVTIAHLSFSRPQGFAILVKGVIDLELYGCKIHNSSPIESIQSGEIFFTGGGILIAPDIDLTTQKPLTTISGTLSINENEMEMDLGAPYRTLGILLSQLGVVPNPLDPLSPVIKPVNATIARNTVTNVTARGVDLRNITGQAAVLSNVITMHPDGVTGDKSDFLVSGIFCLGSSASKYSVSSNEVHCANEKAAGIRLYGKSPTPLHGAKVEFNEIFMSKPEDKISSAQNVGIEVRGNTSENLVSHNTVLGAANAAFSAIKDNQYVPDLSLFRENHQVDFSPLVADIVVDDGAKNTQIIAPPEYRDGSSGAAGTVKKNKSTTIIGDYKVL